MHSNRKKLKALRALIYEIGVIVLVPLQGKDESHISDAVKTGLDRLAG